MPVLDPNTEPPEDETNEAKALSMMEKRQKRLEFARQKMMDPGSDPPLFPRGAMVVPWVLLVILMPLVVGIGAPMWADSVRRDERRERRARRNAMKAKRQMKIDAQKRTQQAYDIAERHYDQGDYRSAIEEYSTFLASNPNHTQAHWKRGLAYFEIQDLDAARGDFDAVIRLQPGHAYSYRSRGQIKALQGDKQGAILDFIRCHDLDPSSAYAAIWIAGLGGSTERLVPFASGTQWINDVCRYYLDRMTADELIERAKRGKSETEKAEQLCEAYGYIGLRLETAGERNEAMRRYRDCVDTRVTQFIEYRWAIIRLNQEGRRIPNGEFDLERD